MITISDKKYHLNIWIQISKKQTLNNYKLKMASALKFDDLFKYAGGLGYFQILQFVILNMIGIFGPEPVYVNFIAAELPHWCKVDGLSDRIPFADQKQVAIPFDGLYIYWSFV